MAIVRSYDHGRWTVISNIGRGLVGVALVLGLVASGVKTTFGDVLPKVHNPPSEVLRSARIVNLKAFPEVVVIGFYQGPVVKTGYLAYRVDEKPLGKGHRKNTLSLYWTTKEKFSTLNLKKLAVNTLPNGTLVPSALTLLAENFEPSVRPLNTSGKTIESAYRPSRENVEYSLAGTPGENLQLYLSKRTFFIDGKDGTEEKMETFPNPLVRQPGGKKS